MNSDENSVSVRPFGYRAPRISTSFSFSIEVMSTGARYDALCSDISEDGLAAEVPQPLAPQTEATMRMLLPGGTVLLHIPGSVEYCQDGRCGLTFLYSSPQERRQIQMFIQSFA